MSYATPAKKDTYNEHLVTAATHLKDDSTMHESRYVQQDRLLDDIESRIEQIGKELADIQSQVLRTDRKDVTRRTELENRRSQLRKDLEDLDHRHRILIIEREAAEDRNEDTNQDRYGERSRGEDRSSQVKFDQTVQRIKDIYANEPKTAQFRPVRESGTTEQRTTETKGQEALRQSRRRLRILELEAELAASAIRRSRRIQLEVELDTLRTYSYYPFTFSDYYSIYYPYYRSLYYDYPYTSSYLLSPYYRYLYI